MSKCERKVVRKFALETEKLMHSLCPTDRANKSKQYWHKLGTISTIFTVGETLFTFERIVWPTLQVWADLPPSSVLRSFCRSILRSGVSWPLSTNWSLCRTDRRIRSVVFEIIKKRGKDGGEKGTLANLRSEKMVAMSICFAFALHTFSNSPIDNIEVTKGQVQILFVQQ